MRIEDELPRRRDSSVKRNFEKENDYIPKKWKEIHYSDTDEFVNAMINNKKDKFFSNLKLIFSILLVFSCGLLLITCIITIIVAHAPYQTVDIILIVVIGIFGGLVLFYSPAHAKFLRLLKN
jgi:cytochrome c biogenesis protein CcdA